MRAYYNDNDRYVAAWLRNLIAAGLIPDGDVDERDIHDVQPADLRGYGQVHLFCGIAGWPYALQLAGWPPDAVVWTGSCPCQPYSAAGKGGGDDDPRNLWPEFRRLVAECQPPIVFGEQVASADGRAWLSGVRADLEDLGYAVGAADLSAASVGAPHIRQRLYWVAESASERLEGWSNGRTRVAAESNRLLFTRSGQYVADGLADAQSSERQRDRAEQGRREDRLTNGSGRTGGVGYPSIDGRGARRAEPERGSVAARRDASGLDDTASDGAQHTREAKPEGHGAHDGVPRATGPWSDAVLILCADGKTRRLESGLSPLAHGVPARVGKLRAYGNAIVPQVAAEFVRAYLASQGAPRG